METIRTGILVGTGAAINVELGWIPDFVEVWNATDGDLVTSAFINEQVIPFSSGGTYEIKPGDTIIGASSGARAIVSKVLVGSGSWPGGDAAGFFVVARDDIQGTFGSENVYAEGSGTANDATVTANVTHAFATSTAVATASGASAITPYPGTNGGAAQGFTIGSTVSEAGKCLRWIAMRNG